MSQTYSVPLTGCASNRVSVVWLLPIKNFILIYRYCCYYTCTQSYIPPTILWHMYCCILHRQRSRWQGTTVRVASLRLMCSRLKEEGQKRNVNNTQLVTVMWWVISY
jgi:hypothetical protein